MKVALITDTHLNNNNTGLVEDIFDQLFLYCEENNINRIFHLGDFFTSRSGQGLLSLKAGMRIIGKCQNFDFNIIPGNHDKTDLDNDSSYIDIFEQYDINIHRSPSSLDLKHGNKRIYCWFLPYYKENTVYPGKLKSITKKIKESKNTSNFLFTHIAVSGVSNNDGHKVDNDLKTSLFSKFNRVFVGHYHNEQKFKNIHYIGSAKASNFGEDNNKGFYILDLVSGATEKILTDFPKYVTETVNIEEVNNELIEQLLQQKKQGSNVRLKLYGSRESLFSFKDERLENIHVVKEPEVKKTKFKKSDLVISNPKVDFLKFSRAKNIDSNIVKLGLKYIAECGI